MLTGLLLAPVSALAEDNRLALIDMWMANPNDVVLAGDSNSAEFPFTDYTLANGKVLLLANVGLQGNGSVGVSYYLPQFLSKMTAPPKVVIFYCPVTNDRLISEQPYQISDAQWQHTVYTCLIALLQQYPNLKLLLETCYLPTRKEGEFVDGPAVFSLNGQIRTNLYPQLTAQFPDRTWLCDTGSFCQDPNDPGWAYAPNMLSDGEHAGWQFHVQRRAWHTYYLNQMGL